MNVPYKSKARGKTLKLIKKTGPNKITQLGKSAKNNKSTEVIEWDNMIKVTCPQIKDCLEKSVIARAQIKIHCLEKNKNNKNTRLSIIACTTQFAAI